MTRGRDKHAPAMGKAFTLGQRVDYDVQVRPISEER